MEVNFVSKQIKLAYAALQNAGDAFNKPLVEKYSGSEVVRAKMYETDMLALGGGLANIQYDSSFYKKTAQFVLGKTKGTKPLYVWGSGFLYGNSEAEFYRKNMIICALRGELSRLKVSKLLGKEIDVPLCDPGLLIDRVYPQRFNKEYRLGIIAHYSESDHPYFSQIKEKNSDSIVIDIMKSPAEVFEEISKCEYVISSSLHGLVFSDALGIPNLHLKVTDKLGGDGFKFDDYYSSFGIKHICWDIKEKNELPTIQNIKDLYRVSLSEAEKKKDALIAAFPKELKA